MATRTYRIRPGFTFRDGDQIKSGGDEIELPLDMAIFHRDKLEGVVLEEAPAVRAEEAGDVAEGVLEAPEVVQTSAQVGGEEG